MTVLGYALDRTIMIRAPRDLVFRYFVDSARWAAWWGAGSTIDARPGGDLRIRYPDGSEAIGQVLEIVEPSLITFTFGYASGKMIPPGGSRVTIQIEPDADGTRVSLRHEFADASTRDHHVQGWRYQVSLFGNVVLNELHAGAADLADAWFAAWGIADEAERHTALRRIAVESVTFRDRFSMVDGLADLVPHIGAALRFMPGIRLQRTGEPRHCQGHVLVDWRAVTESGERRATGTNLFVMGADARIAAVIGFWN